jgi:hypothetical protein
VSANPASTLETEAEPELSPRADHALRVVSWSVVAVLAAGWIGLFSNVLARSLAPPPPPPPVAEKPAPAPPAKPTAAPPVTKTPTSPRTATNEPLRTAISRYGRAAVTAAQYEAQQWYDRWAEATWANHPTAADALKHLNEAAATIGLTPAQLGFDMNIAPTPAPVPTPAPAPGPPSR